MNEKDRKNDRYERMSPRELNAELIKVYRQIPKTELPEIRESIFSSQQDLNTFIDFTNKVFERAEERKKSEHKKRLEQIHSSLIRRSHLSPFFQDSTNHIFSAAYQLGFSLDIPIPEELQKSPLLRFTSRDLLDLGNPGSAGIFDPERAKEIERKAYRARLVQNTYNREGISKLGIQIHPIQLEVEGKWQGEWLNQFLQKHGELP